MKMIVARGQMRKAWKREMRENESRAPWSDIQKKISNVKNKIIEKNKIKYDYDYITLLLFLLF